MSDEKEQEHSRAEAQGRREHRKTGTMVENEIQTFVMPGCPPQRPSASAGEKAFGNLYSM